MARVIITEGAGGGGGRKGTYRGEKRGAEKVEQADLMTKKTPEIAGQSNEWPWGSMS